MISHSKKFVFIHNPKTAGTSITSILQPYCEVLPNQDTNSPFFYHASAMKVKNFFIKMDWNWDAYYKFTFVRNPWDRLVSYYEFMKKRYNDLLNENKLNTDIICKEFGENVNSFDDFILNLNIFAPNTDEHYHSINNKPSLDYVGKLESIQTDFKIICNKIGIPYTEIPRLQTSERISYENYYNENTANIVKNKFANDIKLFGYTFKQKKIKQNKKGFLKYWYADFKNEQKQKHFNAYNARKPNS
tara:strand:- start:256 stop:990 length:735 start_codon:yes stop_codon:yes gene_type:complete